jgi:competence protein ComEC
MGLAAIAVALLAFAMAVIRVVATHDDPVAQLAAQWRQATLVGSVRSDPRVVRSSFSRSVVVTVLVSEVDTGAAQVRVRTSVRVLAGEVWARVRMGETIRFSGRLQPADEPQTSAVVRVSERSPPQRVAGPSVWWRAADRVRASIRASVSGRPAEQAALVPALVDGDTATIPTGLAGDFKIAGLTHLLAVSGTNLTLVVGALLWLARWCRVRGRWLILVGALGIAGFVLLARTEPSVVRAAAMGTVGLIAMSSNGRHRGLRALGIAVLLLVLFDPVIAISIGFALSVLATAGILLIAPVWRDALGRWLPRWLAEAVAVPTAAQLACTPLIAAISGNVSLVAVGANLLAEPAVGPATVLGLVGGVVGLAWPAAGSWVGWLASWCVAWIIAVAHRSAALPGAQTGWSGGVVGIAMLTLLTLLVAFGAPRLLRRRRVGVALATALVLVIGVRPPQGAWPPPGWVLVMCDVGQGDGLVLSVGSGAAVVIDAGPDPAPMEACLDRLGVRRVPLAVFTHFDADHVGGAEAVFHHRRVGEVWTTVLPGPAYGRGLVLAAAKAGGVRPTAAQQGRSITVGPVTAQVLWPPPTLSPATDSNGGSVVLLVRTGGLSLLLTGDVDPQGSARIATAVPGLRVDVLKVPHHGSRFQDEDWLVSLGARVALTSVGRDNGYGHPADSTLDPLRVAGARIARTDQDGAIAVVARPSGLEVRTHR